jgi:hypothetical protein
MKDKPKIIKGVKFIPCSEAKQTYHYHRTNKNASISNKAVLKKNSKRNKTNKRKNEG